jgi:Uma2 family endonuclease
VKEYWIIDVDNETVEQYLLNDEKRYELFVKLNEGTVYCKTVSVFNIPVRALFDETIYNDTLKQMI